MEILRIKYHNQDMTKLEKTAKGDWIDLRASKTYNLKKGEFALIDLGVSMKLPRGYEAHLVPRSSTYKNYHIIQTNSMGIIDNSYCGTNDVWKIPVIATEDTTINFNDRICQFRIVRKMPDIYVIEQDKLEDTDRGGFGSTGVK